IILGVDPGLRITGYGLIEAGLPERIKLIEAGIIRTSTKDGISGRLKRIYSGLHDLVSKYRPDVLVLEKLYSHSRHPTTSILMAHARGVICLLSGLNGIRLVNYPSTRVKKSISGSGHASKVQIQKVMMDTLKLHKCPEPVDVTDALSLALGFVNIEMRGGWR
ncbi:MAG: crossover junction endodeoxyribonuclease RuvC, partial [Candidatus Omnitrophota bacterium]